ncbi:MAG: M16 family metallopeptidase [Gemmatimonadota bacterium]
MALEHERHRLPGGTVVLARRLTANDIVAVRAFTPMGTLYETDEEAGVSNLMQSALIRGTASRSAHEIQEALAELGADLDSGCGRHLGSVSLQATAASWERALDLFLDVITQSVFPEAEVATEIELALGAIEAREDQLLTRALDLFREQFYAGHPFHKPVLGYRETVRALDRDRVVEAARRFYRPVPPVVAAAGRFDPERLLERLDEAFGEVPLEPREAMPEPAHPAGGTRRLEVDREAAYLVYGFPAPDAMAAEYPAARMLDAVLGGSMSSRLFIELREKRSLAYQVSSYYDDQPGGGHLAGYIVTDPGRVDEAARGLEREFQRFVDEPVTDGELETARRYLRGSYLISAETNMAQAGRLARYEVDGLGQDFGDRWLAALQDVTADQVRAVARKHFTGEPTRAWVLPRGAGEAAA